MRYLFFLLIISNFANRSFCQGKESIQVDAKVVQGSSGIYKLMVTFEADASLYTVSMFQDTIVNPLIPIEISFKEDKYLNPVGEWVEYPNVEKSDHWVFGEGLYVKKRTTYSRQFILKKEIDFTSYFEVMYWALDDLHSKAPITVKYEIQCTNKSFIIKGLNE